MALSPAQKHRLKVQTVLIAVRSGSIGNETVAPARPEAGEEASAYALLRAEFGEDLRRLHDIESTELKIETKREMFPKYLDHIDAVLDIALETGAAVQDEVFANLMIWAFDIGEFRQALDMAEHVLTYGLTLPERFARSPATLIVEEMAEGTQKLFDRDEPVDLNLLQRTLTLSEGRDVFDGVRAKLHRIYGLALARHADSIEGDANGPAGAQKAARAEALKHLRRALQLNPKIGVKKNADVLERQLKKEIPADTAGT